MQTVGTERPQTLQCRCALHFSGQGQRIDDPGRPACPIARRAGACLETMEDLPDSSPIDPIHEPRLWRDNGWTARVIKNEDGEGWAVEMTRDGEAEPALVGPWTMGRNKVDPKPLDAAAHQTLVKTASEVIRRHEQQLHATLNRQVRIDGDAGPVQVRLVITPDEFEPFGTLTAIDALGERIAETRVSPSFRLTRESALAWAAKGYGRIG